MGTTTYRKCTNMVLVFLTIITWVAVFPGIAKSSINTDDVDAAKDSVCHTPECVQAATSILKKIDKSVNPCDDFYQFTCGKFMKEAVIPDTRSSITTLNELDDKLHKQLRQSMTVRIRHGDLRAISLSKSFYSMCMGAGIVEENSIRDLRDALKILGGWPVLEGQSWNEADFDWKKAVYNFSKMGHNDNIFVTLNVFMDQDNSNVFIVYMNPAEIEILPAHVGDGADDTFVRAYFKFMIDAVVYMGADEGEAKRELQDALNFEVELAKMSLPQEDQQDLAQLNNRMTLQQLEANIPGIPWKEYINEILVPIQHITDNEEILVTVPSFLQKLPELIAKTPKRVLANYALWHVVRKSMPFIGERASNIEAEFVQTTKGKNLPQWEKCIETTQELFGVALARLYVDLYSNANARTVTAGMIKNVKIGLRQLIEQADWMDPETRSAALDKVEAIEQYVGYPDELLNDEKLKEYYKDLKMDSGSYLKSVYNLRRFNRERELSRLRKSYKETKWELHTNLLTLGNTYYDVSGNTMIIAASTLLEPLFDSGRPNYMNYGALGWFIGHEMSHAFDTIGSQYDKNGNLVNWWKDETREEYLKRVNCTIELANNYTIKGTGVKLNGIMTQSENIADHGGLKAVYNAYKQLALTAEEPRLPELNYTPQQMFWISAAHTWCEKKRPKAAVIEAQTEVHSPGDFRVIASMSNIPEFSKDFNCRPGSFMNPVEKCSVW